MEGIAVYLHIPFCERKCFYCAFNSYPKEQFSTERFVTALEREIERWGKEQDPFLFPVSSLFLGGGTPTCLQATELQRILASCRRYFVFADDAELSIEVNPGTVQRDKLSLLRELGINRLSFGVQSLSNRWLKFLGRIHTKEEFLENYFLARELGFENINLDFMFALPGQKLEEWQETLQEAVGLAPEHLSTYNLVVEPGTIFAEQLAEKKLIMPEEELDLSMYEMTMEILQKNGYHHYEISNFAKPGKQCCHNLVYWRNRSYLGFGPGAHSYWQGKRFFNCYDPEDYRKQLLTEGHAHAFTEEIKPTLEQSETMMQGLRLYEGISLTAFEQRFGMSLLTVYDEPIKKLQKLGLIALDRGKIRLTRRGLYLANSVFEEFF